MKSENKTSVEIVTDKDLPRLGAGRILAYTLAKDLGTFSIQASCFLTASVLAGVLLSTVAYDELSGARGHNLEVESKNVANFNVAKDRAQSDYFDARKSLNMAVYSDMRETIPYVKYSPSAEIRWVEVDSGMAEKLKTSIGEKFVTVEPSEEDNNLFKLQVKSLETLASERMAGVLLPKQKTGFGIVANATGGVYGLLSVGFGLGVLLNFAASRIGLLKSPRFHNWLRKGMKPEVQEPSEIKV